MTATKIKNDARAREYLKNGMNATEVIKKEKPNLKHESAKTAGSRMLSNVHFNKSIQEILEDKDVSNEMLTEEQKKVIKQDVNLSAKNQAIELAHKLKGNLKDKDRSTIKLKGDIDVNDEGQLNARLKEIIIELEA